MHIWQVQEAKAQFSTVLRDAELEGPQEITNHGRSVAVLLCRSDYDRLTGANKSLVDFMRTSPLYNSEDVIIERDKSPTRNSSL
ncbi:prevent-host-death family protein [Polynucleobacter meluiroseus]|uniref:Antitoxin n=1 Tax=Polynucleobacter meluiroseus TaxID=1938814 RepID=A0A240E1M2_9BURK|nr:type II toxin-antitoxin system Phd/YefM family antitoxin [Polynucleobacter meluiroseus]SNX29127.1 prevent-host-death family protein [Polynucleobacter meluiroseus]